MPEPIQVFEHQLLRIDEHGLSEGAFEALIRFNQLHDDRFFVVRHRALKFTSYVGVLRVGGITIEVLPKAGRGEPEDKERWHGALIDMLRACGYLKLAAVTTAQLRLRRASLFDLYMEAFLNHVRELLYQGLVRKYRQVSGNVTALKGRLLFSRQVAENLVHRERFFTAHQQYDRNNRFNRILRLAVTIVASAARSRALRAAADDVLNWMEDIDNRPVPTETLARVRFDRSTERYRPAIALARMIILNYQPDVRTGSQDVLALLFDMNELFEEYVFWRLKRAAADATGNIQVRRQQSQKFWRTEIGTRAIRPDIVVTRENSPGNAETVILDTKWKVPAGAHPDDADLKQMYAYNLQYGASRSFLLYPRVDDRHDIVGQFLPPYHDQALTHRCGMWFIGLFDGEKLSPDLGSRILEKLESAGPCLPHHPATA